jgi:hypothetical protein
MVMRNGVTDLAQSPLQARIRKIGGRWEVPKSGHAAGVRFALPQQDSAASAHDQQRALYLHWRRSAQLHRQLRHGSGGS